MTTASPTPPPTPNSNFLLRDKILFGWYPTDPSSSGIYSNNIDSILKTGREVFVNLTTSHERAQLYNYIPRVKECVKNPIFLSFEIPDLGIPQDLPEFCKFILQLKSILNEGKNIYLHCRGGHGRSGLVTACLLISLDMSPEDALFEVKLSHSTREYYPDFPCPQTKEQIEFVKAFPQEFC